MSPSRILKTKLQAPRLRSPFFPRPGIKGSLEQIEDYALILIQAGPGYGKTTLLTEFCNGTSWPCLWYRLQEDDSDWKTFLRHLNHLLARQVPEITDYENMDYQEHLEYLINDLFEHLSRDMVLILDNYQNVAGESRINEIVSRLVEIGPQRLHLVILSRIIPPLPRLASWRARGDILEIRREALALSREEIREYFVQQHNYQLGEAELEAITRLSRGWIMALEQFWPLLKQGLNIEEIKDKPREKLPWLWDFMEEELLAPREEELQDFLLQTSILQDLEEPACNYLTGREDSRIILEDLLEKGLLLQEVEAGSYAYHPLWRYFLQEKLFSRNSQWADLHYQVAQFFQDRSQLQPAIYHLLEAGDQRGAAQLMVQNMQQLEKSIPQQKIKEWMGRIDDQVFVSFPRLLIYRGDLARYSSDYSNALSYYHQAREIFQKRGDSEGRLQAYQKLAMVHLDTVEPARAEDYLRQGLALQAEVERTGETHLLELLAENKANRGDAQGARRLLQASHKLGEEASSPGLELHLESRLLLRTGRLEQARQMLEQVVEGSGVSPGRVPRTHRESPMVLSLLYVFAGEFQQAIYWARQGLRLARSLESPFTEAVGYMRLGHAYQLKYPEQPQKAADYYHQALELMDKVGVQRGRVEGLWGLTNNFGQVGNLVQAQKYGEEGLNLALQAGDEWMANLVRLALGIAFLQAHQPGEGQKFLETARENFISLNDLFGQTLACLWLGLSGFANDRVYWKERFLKALELARQEGYGFLLQHPNLLGVRDPRRLMPPLIELEDELEQDLKTWVQEQSGIRRWDYHPGYTLIIKALGPMRLWRGGEEITDGHWKREKAKELFQLFLAFREELLPRERIYELLWPHQDLETAARDFKVALNSLNSVLEPDRRARTAPYFIKRTGQAYGLDREAFWDLDVDRFEEKIKRGLNDNDPDILAEAVELYQGDFLSFSLYFDWVREPREKLRRLFFQGCERLARYYLQSNQPEKALEISEKMLSRDRCWEVAYQLAMEGYLQLGNRYLAQRICLDCIRVLQEELGVEPLPATREYIEKVFTPEELDRMEKELAREGGLRRNAQD